MKHANYGSHNPYSQPGDIDIPDVPLHDDAANGTGSYEYDCGLYVSKASFNPDGPFNETTAFSTSGGSPTTHKKDEY